MGIFVLRRMFITVPHYTLSMIWLIMCCSLFSFMRHVRLRRVLRCPALLAFVSFSVLLVFNDEGIFLRKNLEGCTLWNNDCILHYPTN